MYPASFDRLVQMRAGRNGLPSKKSQIISIFSSCLLTESPVYPHIEILESALIGDLFAKNTLVFIFFQSPENLGRLPYGVME